MNLYFREYNKTTNTFGDEKTLELNDFRAVSSDNPFIIAQFMPKSEIEEKNANGNFIYKEDTRKCLMNLRENYFAMYGKITTMKQRIRMQVHQSIKYFIQRLVLKMEQDLLIIRNQK